MIKEGEEGEEGKAHIYTTLCGTVLCVSTKTFACCHTADEGQGGSRIRGFGNTAIKPRSSTAS